LRGITRSFEKKNEKELSPEILKFGKYFGKSIKEVVKTDIQYILWVSNNAFNKETQEACNNLPEVIKHREEEKVELEARKSTCVKVVNGKVKLTFSSNPNRSASEIIDGYGNKYY